MIPVGLQIPFSEIGDSKEPCNSVCYARKGKTTVEKMRYQLEMALGDPMGDSKCETEHFIVRLPRSLMGKPIKNLPFTSGVARNQGAKSHQEDQFLRDQWVSFVCKGENKRGRLFGVFDGHRDDGKMGLFLKKQLSKRLGEILTGLLKNSDSVSDEAVTNAFTQVFQDLSDAYRESGGVYGATATCLFQFEDRIYCPNVGDARTILVKPNVTYQLTEDACVTNPRFQKWHNKAKNAIEDWGTGFRILPKGGNIPLHNVARDVGADQWMCHRPKITAVSHGNKKDNLEVGKIYCQPGCYFVLASDGLYEDAKTKEIGHAVRKLASKGASPDVIASVIAEKAGHYKGNDNVTVLVVAV